MFFPHYLLVTSQGATTLLKNNKGCRRRETSSKVSRGHRNFAKGSVYLEQATKKQPLQNQTQPNPAARTCFVWGSSKSPGNHMHWLLFHLKVYTHQYQVIRAPALGYPLIVLEEVRGCPREHPAPSKEMQASARSRSIIPFPLLSSSSLTTALFLSRVSKCSPGWPRTHQ